MKLLAQPDTIKRYLCGAASDLRLELDRNYEWRIRRELHSIQRWLRRHRPDLRSLRESLQQIVPELLHSQSIESWIASFVRAASRSSSLTRFAASLKKVSLIADASCKRTAVDEIRHRFRLLAAFDVLLLGRDRRTYYSPWHLHAATLREIFEGAFVESALLVDAVMVLSRRKFAMRIASLTEAMFTLRDYAAPTWVGDRVLDAIAIMTPTLRSARGLPAGRDWRDLHLVQWLRARYGAAELEVVYRQAIRDKAFNERWRIVDCIVNSRVSAPTRRDALLRAVKDADRSVRWRAIEGLRSVPDVSAARGICGALTDGDEWVSWHARRALVTRPGAAALIRRFLRHESAPLTKAALLSCLAQIANRNHYLAIFLRAARDRSADVRAAAIPYLVRCAGSRRARLEVFARFADESSNVRATAIKCALRMYDIGDLPVETLSNAQRDRDRDVRAAAALLLSRAGIASAAVVDDLVRTLASPQFGVDAFERLAASAPRRLERCDPKLLALAVSESVARGVLPTVGAKLWERDAVVEFPSRKYPWVDHGVRHAWQSQTAVADHRGVTQLCVHADWFRDVHWIALADIMVAGHICAPLEEAPASIEGNDVGLILESGGHTVWIDGMRAWPNVTLTDRIDFLYVNSPEVIQMLMYMALTARTFPTSTADQFARRASKRFRRRFADAMSEAGFKRLLDTAWYTKRGWKSSRYGIRHERPYGAIRKDLMRLDDYLRSRRAASFRAKLAASIRNEIDAVANVLWRTRLQRYPSVVLQRLASIDMPQYVSRYARTAAHQATH